MQHLRHIGHLILLVGALIFASCELVEPNRTASSNTSGTSGKIAITTSSEDARKEFLAGRDLSEKLRITDSIQHFDKAISLDPNFALALCDFASLRRNEHCQPKIRALTSPDVDRFCPTYRERIGTTAFRVQIAERRNTKSGQCGEVSEEPGPQDG